MNRTKKSLLMSILSLLLCLSMLVGTTYAWFTDSVTSSGNKIVAGNLSVDLLHLVDDEWVSLKKDPDHKIFNYDRWEPGYTRLEKIKVANLGDLALQYRLSASVKAGTEINGQRGERLSDVIDVYLYRGESSAVSFAEVKSDSAWVKAGTLTELQSKIGGFVNGSILPAGATATGTDAVGEEVVSVALHMQESAGNEYQLLSVGDFYLTLAATQYTYESDSFDDQYDKEAESAFPSQKFNYSIKAPVTVAADGSAESTVSITDPDGYIHAQVPAGTKLNPGVTELTLTVNDLDKTNANINADEGAELRSVDVHVEGVAPDNTTPIIVTVKGIMPFALNRGNFTLYHVENGTPVAMTHVLDESELDAHNEFTYDPATGDVRMALASFSEVALGVTKAVWSGDYSKPNYTWYTGAAADATTYNISNADQLVGFALMVGGMQPDNIAEGKPVSFASKTVRLHFDLDLGGKLFYPIGYYNSTGSFDRSVAEQAADFESTVLEFEGLFDGNGHTIKNFYQNTWDMVGDDPHYSSSERYYNDAMGLFGYIYGGEVRNLSVADFSSDGEFTPTGVIAAYADSTAKKSATFQNITIFNCNPRVYNTGNGGIVGILGRDSDTTKGIMPAVFNNITVDRSNKISALWGSWDVACGGIIGMYRGRAQVKFTNCHVAAQIDAYNDVCGNYQYYWYRYSGMFIGSVFESTTDAKGYTVPDISTVSATGCTVHYGDWNNYYYCELVANSLASYTHDHQMSRLTEVKSVDGTTITPLEGEAFTVPSSGRYNYVVVNGTHGTDNATCYHFVNGKQHFHDVADADNPVVEETVNGQKVLKEDKQHIYLPFKDQLFQGYGWGVKHIPISEYDNDQICVLDKVEPDADGFSVEKFTVAVKGNSKSNPLSIVSGYKVYMSSLFEEIENTLGIDTDNVMVTIAREGGSDTRYITSHTDKVYHNDWKQISHTFGNSGLYSITIRDFYFSTPVVLWARISDPTQPDGNYVYLTDMDTELDTNKFTGTIVHSIEDAYAALDDASDGNGGQIIVVGKYSMNHIFQPAAAHTDTITVRGVDGSSIFSVTKRGELANELDYTRYFCSGPTEFTDLRLEAAEKKVDGGKLSFNLVAGYNDLTITDTFTSNPRDNKFIIVLGIQGAGNNTGSPVTWRENPQAVINGGQWNQVVGIMRNGYNAPKDYSGTETLVFFDSQIKSSGTMNMSIRVGGDAYINGLYTFALDMTDDAMKLNGTVKYSYLGKNLSCDLYLDGGVINSYVCTTDGKYNGEYMGFHDGFRVHVSDDFDWSKSFNGSTYGGLYGESFSTDSTRPMVGKSYLVAENEIALANALNSGKVHKDTFLSYGLKDQFILTDIPEKADVGNATIYFISRNGEADGDGKTNTTPARASDNSDWSTGVLSTLVSGGGSFKLVADCVLGNITSDKELRFATSGEPTAAESQKFLIVSSSPTINASVHITNLKLRSSNNATKNVTLTVGKNGCLSIGPNVVYQKITGATYGIDLVVNGYLHLNTLDQLSSVGFASITGSGCIVLTDEQINRLNSRDDDNTINAHKVLRSFVSGGGSVVDVRGVKLRSYALDSQESLYVIGTMSGNLPYTRAKTGLREELTDAAPGTMMYRDIVYTNSTINGRGLSENDPIMTLTRAYSVLGPSGGTIALTSDFNFSPQSSSWVPDADVAISGVNSHYGNVTITSSGANKKFNVTKDSDFVLDGPTTFDNITMVSNGYGLVIVANYYKVVIGDGVILDGFTGTTIDKTFSVVGGFSNGRDTAEYRDQSVIPERAEIVVGKVTVANGGNGITIVGLNRNTYSTAYDYTAYDHLDSEITINGAVIRAIYAANSNNGTTSGSATVTINGNVTFNSAKTISFRNCSPAADSTLTLNINGGEYTGVKFTSTENVTINDPRGFLG